MTTRRILPVLALAAALAACAGEADDAGTAAPTTSATSATPSVTPSPTPRDVDPALADVVDLAITDLAGRLDVAEDAITVVSAEAVEWGDTSLGCPAPDQRYSQVVTPGSKVVLEHDSTTYPYHAGGDRPGPFLCEAVGEAPGPHLEPPMTDPT